VRTFFVFETRNCALRLRQFPPHSPPYLEETHIFKRHFQCSKSCKGRESCVTGETNVWFFGKFEMETPPPAPERQVPLTDCVPPHFNFSPSSFPAEIFRPSLQLPKIYLAGAWQEPRGLSSNQQSIGGWHHFLFFFLDSFHR
jgi:hypothetical protein